MSKGLRFKSAALCFALALSFAATAAAKVMDKKAMLEEKEAYFKNPKNDVLVLVESLGPTGWYGEGVVTGQYSVLSSSQSFQANTPIALRIPIEEALGSLIQDYKNNPGMRSKYLNQARALPVIVTGTFQSQDTRGISGAIYFRGKKEVSDIANTQYGVVNMSFSVPLADILKSLGENS